MLSCQLLLTKVDHIEAQNQAAQRHSGALHPLRWQSFLHQLSRGGVGRIALPGPGQKGVVVAWAATREALLAALFGRKMAYLAWGVGHFTGWRRQLIRFLLSRSATVLVNDDVTREEVARLSGRQARLIPYLVDTEFYQYTPLKGRKASLFCPGSNDRDAALLVALAERGETIVWLNNDPHLVARFQDASPNLRIVSRPSYAELRTLYQQARACILPLSQDIHAAGQTTALEAMACGTPVLVSAGRTASIFAGAGVVQALASNDAADWAQALESLPDQAECLRRRSHVEDHHSFKPVAQALVAALQADFPELRG